LNKLIGHALHFCCILLFLPHKLFIFSTGNSSERIINKKNPVCSLKDKQNRKTFELLQGTIQLTTRRVFRSHSIRKH